MIRSFQQENMIPGIFVAVVRDDNVLYQQGFGFADIKKKKPITSSTCMELGSVSKAFTAEIIYDLHKERLLNINDPITKYLNGAPTSWNKISIHHLLTHNSGLLNYLADPRFRASDYFLATTDPTAERFFNEITRDSMVSLFYTLPFDFEPGTGWAYSNTGYYLLGTIAEKVSGKDLFQLVKENLTGPIGMHHTGTNDLASNEGCLATGYFIKDSIITTARVLTSNYAFSAGAFSTTGEDMIQFIKAIHQRSLPSDKAGYEWRHREENILPFNYEGGRFYSTFNGQRIIYHNGGTPGFSSSWIYSVDKNISIIVLMNRQDYAAIDLLAWDVLSYYEPSLKYPSERLHGKSEQHYEQLLSSISASIQTNSPYHVNFSKPLEKFLESANGRGLWNWYFERGFPIKVYCVDKEQTGMDMTYRFILPYTDNISYRVTLVIDSNNMIKQMRWW